MKRFPVILAVSLLAVVRPCFAWPEYPAAVAADWQLAQQPPCTVCHTTEQGGAGTATKAFARSLQQQGLGAGSDTGLLATLLERVKTCQTDSDGDGVSDFQEITNLSNGNLSAGFADPNDGMGEPTTLCGDLYDGPTARTGCALGPYPAREASPWLCALVAASCLLVRLRCAISGAERRARARATSTQTRLHGGLSQRP